MPRGVHVRVPAPRDPDALGGLPRPRRAPDQDPVVLLRVDVDDASGNSRVLFLLPLKRCCCSYYCSLPSRRRCPSHGVSRLLRQNSLGAQVVVLPRRGDDVGACCRRSGLVPPLAFEAGPHVRRQRPDQGSIVGVRGEHGQLRRERGERVVGVVVKVLLLQLLLLLSLSESSSSSSWDSRRRGSLERVMLQWLLLLVAPAVSSSSAAAASSRRSHGRHRAG